MRHGLRWSFASFLIVILGLAFLARGPIERSRMASVPTMRASEFLRTGPGDHPYVEFTGVRVASRGVALRSDPLAPGGRALFVPAYPAGPGGEPDPSRLPLLLSIHDEELGERLAVAGPVTFTAGVEQGGARLDDWTRSELTRLYPGLPLADVWVLTVGAGEPSPAKASGLTLLGLITIACGALRVLAGYRPANFDSAIALESDAPGAWNENISPGPVAQTFAAANHDPDILAHFMSRPLSPRQRQRS